MICWSRARSSAVHVKWVYVDFAGIIPAPILYWHSRLWAGKPLTGLANASWAWSELGQRHYGILLIYNINNLTQLRLCPGLLWLLVAVRWWTDICEHMFRLHLKDAYMIKNRHSGLILVAQISNIWRAEHLVWVDLTPEDRNAVKGSAQCVRVRGGPFCRSQYEVFQLKS